MLPSWTGFEVLFTFINLSSVSPTANEVRVKTVCFTLLAGTLLHILVKEIAAPTKVPAGTLLITVPMYTCLYADKPISNSFLKIQIITLDFIKRGYFTQYFCQCQFPKVNKTLFVYQRNVSTSWTEKSHRRPFRP